MKTKFVYSNPWNNTLKDCWHNSGGTVPLIWYYLILLITFELVRKSRKSLFSSDTQAEVSLKKSTSKMNKMHCVKSVRIWIYSGPHFPEFGVNTEKYSVSFRIQLECRKIWTRITPNMDTFYAVIVISSIF